MAVNALHAAATGMNALSTELDVISNNLANVNTNGFKASRVNFEDLFYLQKRQPGLEGGAETTPLAGLQVGLGTRISNTQYDFTSGSSVESAGDFDMFIAGDGFFEVEIGKDIFTVGMYFEREDLWKGRNQLRAWHFFLCFVCVLC